MIKLCIGRYFSVCRKNVLLSNIQLKITHALFRASIILKDNSNSLKLGLLDLSQPFVEIVCQMVSQTFIFYNKFCKILATSLTWEPTLTNFANPKPPLHNEIFTSKGPGQQNCPARVIPRDLRGFNVVSGYYDSFKATSLKIWQYNNRSFLIF